MKHVKVSFNRLWHCHTRSWQYPLSSFLKPPDLLRKRDGSKRLLYSKASCLLTEPSPVWVRFGDGCFISSSTLRVGSQVESDEGSQLLADPGSDSECLSEREAADCQVRSLLSFKR
mmetsp:Transcript_8063/g.17438  ORF Transcript_8063/g.17438 Transcript_8063/m.17438 type:complete len:116 (+) Transcript_8063:319-666(+)